MVNIYQTKFGYPAERTKGKVKPRTAAWIRDFIRHAPFCVRATSPRALRFSRLWDVVTIARNLAKPPIGVKEPGISGGADA